MQSSRLRAVSVILALAFIFVLSAAAVNPGEQVAGENTVPYYARSEKDSYEYETISELNGISLAVDKNQAAIMVTDTTGRSGTVPGIIWKTIVQFRHQNGDGFAYTGVLRGHYRKHNSPSTAMPPA